jgi:hypothetical protein
MPCPSAVGAKFLPSPLKMTSGSVGMDSESFPPSARDLTRHAQEEKIDVKD